MTGVGGPGTGSGKLDHGRRPAPGSRAADRSARARVSLACCPRGPETELAGTGGRASIQHRIDGGSGLANQIVLDVHGPSPEIGVCQFERGQKAITLAPRRSPGQLQLALGHKKRESSGRLE